MNSVTEGLEQQHTWLRQSHQPRLLPRDTLLGHQDPQKYHRHIQPLQRNPVLRRQESGGGAVLQKASAFKQTHHP